jgi:hypothetical protein
MNQPSQSGRQKMRVRSVRFWVPSLILGALFAVVGGLPLIDNLRFVARAEGADGVVVDLVDRGDYHPVVRFVTADEQSVQFEAGESAGDPSFFRVGESVGILYDPENPKDARLDTWVSRWGADAVLPLLGCFIFLLSLAGVVQSRLARRSLTSRGSHLNERFFPVPAAQAFLALNRAVSNKFNVEQSVDSTMCISFNKGVGLFSWGESLSARVASSEGGAVVHVEAVSKIPGQLGEIRRLRKLADGLFADLTNLLRSEAGGSWANTPRHK